MIRAPLLVAALVLAAASAAGAQTPDLDQARVLMLQQQLDSARLQALDAQREAYAAQARLRTELAVQALDASRTGSPPPAPSPLPYPLARGPAVANSAAALNSQHAADADRILQLQDEALARSNARILAVRPAL